MMLLNEVVVDDTQACVGKRETERNAISMKLTGLGLLLDNGCTNSVE